ncbi:MAG: DUF2577 domain-containing protein [Faecalibacterium sp.]|nr:DUF2577 domain-containing protein [Ruminococcus sp.]MCM1392113.1 DUF2577 domain-containing protein [Ruminococcus sp.]MCM1485810.1 DUF2577 domain-containing protein [Faecalibacterium sp.]
MNGYEKILFQMRRQGAKNAERGVFLAEMISSDTCRCGQLILERDDLLIAEHLLTGFVSADGRTIEPLKNGDAVLVKRLSEEKYAIIERVI